MPSQVKKNKNPAANANPDITERKKIEEALFASEEKYRGLIETIPDIIWETDKNGLYNYISPKITDILGYEPYDLLDKPLFFIMPQEEAEKIGGIFREKAI